MKLAAVYLLTCVISLGNLAEGRGCQQALSHLDKIPESDGYGGYVTAAAKMVTEECREFLMGHKDLDQLSTYKAKMAHVASRLRELDMEDPSFKNSPILLETYRGLFASIAANIEAKDGPTLGFLVSLADKMHQQASEQLDESRIRSEVEGEGQVKSNVESEGQLETQVEEGDRTPVLEKKRASLETLAKHLPPFTGNPTLELLTLYRTITGLHHAGFLTAQKYKKVGQEVAALGSLEGANVEGLGKASHVVQKYNGLVDESQGDLIVSNELEWIEERAATIDKDLKASEYTIKLHGKGAGYYIPCAQILASDFLLLKVKIPEVGPECFHEMPWEPFEFIFTTPYALNSLKDSVWAAMDEEHLYYLYQNELLKEVRSEKLKLIGTDDPSVCNVFDDPALMQEIPNMTDLNADCVAMSYTWGLLVSHMGSKASNDVLEEITAEHLLAFFDENDIAGYVNVGALGGADLRTKQWENLGKRDSSFCDNITMDLLRELPMLADNLRSECIQSRPELIVAVSPEKRPKLVKHVRESPVAKSGDLNGDTLAVVLDMDSIGAIEGLFREADALCGTYAKIIGTVKVPVFVSLRKICGNVGFKQINDDQLQALLRDCSGLDGIDIANIGPERFFEKTTDPCINKLEADALYSFERHEEAVERHIGALSEKQLGALSSETVIKHYGLLKTHQKMAMVREGSPSAHHAAALLANEETAKAFETDTRMSKVRTEV